MSVPLGEKKLGKVITPDPWKTGARNTTGKIYDSFLKSTKCMVYIKSGHYMLCVSQLTRLHLISLFLSGPRMRTLWKYSSTTEVSTLQ